MPVQLFSPRRSIWVQIIAPDAQGLGMLLATWEPAREKASVVKFRFAQESSK
jgi:hypothetical protein